MTNIKRDHWDIFCTVIDNYGDIGVTWRLAKQLSHEFHINVVLWVDDLQSFNHILPSLDPTLTSQRLQNITINQWNCPLDISYQPGKVLIEAFACELPIEVKTTLQPNQTNPVWLNLEYLCAEDWVDGCHGLPSFQTNGINKYFFLPGFTEQSGGLICERELFCQREQWQSEPNNKLILFNKLGLNGISKDDLTISLFSYETEAILALCDHWKKASTPIHLLVPKGRSLNSLQPLLPLPWQQLTSGQKIRHDNLYIHILPMTDQQGYDHLLWSCDLNIVRGEDSFVRAQWAAKPFIWHIYQQQDDYHLVKLEAFMQLYCNNLPLKVAECLKHLNVAFNQQQATTIVEYWQQLQTRIPVLQQHAKHWPIDALKTTDLATRLVQFVEKKLT